MWRSLRDGQVDSYRGFVINWRFLRVRVVQNYLYYCYYQNNQIYVAVKPARRKDSYPAYLFYEQLIFHFYYYRMSKKLTFCSLLSSIPHEIKKTSGTLSKNNKENITDIRHILLSNELPPPLQCRCYWAQSRPWSLLRWADGLRSRPDRCQTLQECQLLGLHRISGLFWYPVSGRISGFVCRISGWLDGRISCQKNITLPRSPPNITIKFRKL